MLSQQGNEGSHSGCDSRKEGRTLPMPGIAGGLEPKALWRPGSGHQRGGWQ